MFKKLNLKTFWYTNLFSFLTLAAGIVLTAKPDIFTSTCKVIGGLGILVGAVLLILFYLPKTRTPEKFSYGCTFFIAGILLAVIPSLLKFLIPVLFGGWILLSSFSGAYRNFIFRNDVPHWWIGFLLCIASAGLGIFIMTRPSEIVNDTVRLIGIGCMIHAVLRIVSSVLGRDGYKAAEQEVIDIKAE